MTLKNFIRDGHYGTGHLAGVSNAGELIISGFGENQSKFNAMNVSAQAFNFFIPKSDNNFVITAILTNVNGGATTLDIFEATSATSTTISKQLLRIATSGASFIPITFGIGGFLTVSEGFFLNATTNNATNNMTIIGFYRPIL